MNSKSNSVFEYNSSFYASVGERGKLAASIVFNRLGLFLRPQKVADFGCGAGTWIKAGQKEFPDSKLYAFDLEFSALAKDEEYLRNHSNLKFIPINFESIDEGKVPEVDLAICLEVAEHLSETSAKRLIDLICARANFVLFSAATPGQGGTHHINEQNHEYWLNRFHGNGFICIDPFRYELSKSNVSSFYKNNIFFFIKVTEILQISSMTELLKALDVIKPTDLRSKAERIQQGLVRLLPTGIVTWIAKIKD